MGRIRRNPHFVIKHVLIYLSKNKNIFFLISTWIVLLLCPRNCSVHLKVLFSGLSFIMMIDLYKYCYDLLWRIELLGEPRALVQTSFALAFSSIYLTTLYCTFHAFKLYFGPYFVEIMGALLFKNAAAFIFSHIIAVDPQNFLLKAFFFFTFIVVFNFLPSVLVLVMLILSIVGSLTKAI